MKKLMYKKPWAEVIEFENEDVITASGDLGGGSGEDEKPDAYKCPQEGHFHPDSWNFDYCWCSNRDATSSQCGQPSKTPPYEP